MRYQPQFPAALKDIAPDLLQRLGKGEAFEPYPGFTVNVNEELLHVPYRVYYDEHRLQQCIQKTTGPTQWLALCLGSRHANGHVREACLRQLIAQDTPGLCPSSSHWAETMCWKLPSFWQPTSISFLPRVTGALRPKTRSL